MLARWRLSALRASRGVLPSVIFLGFVLLAPESPRFLALAGKNDDAFDVLERIGGTATARGQLDEILATRADRAMLDNFSPTEVTVAVERCAGRVEVEVTGGISLATVAAYAAARPDFISVGALTHSAGVIDLGLDLTT